MKDLIIAEVTGEPDSLKQALQFEGVQRMQGDRRDSSPERKEK